MAKNEIILSMHELRPRLRRSECIFRIANWVRALSSICIAAGFILRLVTEYKYGTTLMLIAAAFLVAVSFLQCMTNNRALRTCAHCFQDLPAKEILSAPDTYLCPHCGKPFQAKLRKDEFQF